MSRDVDGIIKQKYAETGDVGLGGLNLTELWPISYSTPGGQFPQRIQFNQLFRYLSALGVEINLKGPFLEWDGTDPEGPDYESGAIVTGSDGRLYLCLVANGPSSTIKDPVGDTTGKWILAPFSDPSINKGHLSGGILSNGIDADHDIDLTSISVGLTNGSDEYKLFHSITPPTKQIDVDWVEGDNDGGFPSGLTLAINTEYKFFIIGKDDGTVDAGFDTDDDATNLLADATDYSWYRQILSVFTDGSSNILPFLQSGDFVGFKTRILDINDATTVLDTYETGTLSVPKNSIAVINSTGDIGSSGDALSINIITKGFTQSSGRAGSFSSIEVGTADIDITFSMNGSILVDSNAQIEYAITAGPANSVIRIFTIGWWDDRGRNQ